MLKPRFILAAIAATAFFGYTREAAAFCRTTTCDANSQSCDTNDEGCVKTGVPVIWKTLPIVYRFYSGGSSKLDDSKVRKAVKAAFATWEGVKCAHGNTSVQFSQGEDITEDKPLTAKEASSAFGIYFRDDSWPHDDANESLALTNQIYGDRFGDISYADIEVNTAENDFTFSNNDATQGIDFQSVMTHEAGHYLGLAHSLNDDSIMVPRYCQSSDRCQTIEAKRELSDDDVQAVCDVYPPGGPSVLDDASQPTTAGCSTTQTTGNSKGQLAESFGFVFLASAILRRRLRRRR